MEIYRFKWKVEDAIENVKAGKGEIDDMMNRGLIFQRDTYFIMRHSWMRGLWGVIWKV